MHWTDPFNDLNKNLKEYAVAGQQLTRVLRSEGWTPEDIAKFANPIFVDLRNIMLLSVRSE